MQLVLIRKGLKMCKDTGSTTIEEVARDLAAVRECSASVDRNITDLVTEIRKLVQHMTENKQALIEGDAGQASEAREARETQRSWVDTRARRYTDAQDVGGATEYETYGGYDMRTVHKMYSDSLRNTKLK